MVSVYRLTIMPIVFTPARVSFVSGASGWPVSPAGPMLGCDVGVEATAVAGLPADGLSVAFRAVFNPGGSPTDALLTDWGRSNRTVVELFKHLAHMKHYQVTSLIFNARTLTLIFCFHG